ncbi:hypothetical protein BH11MYX1_BH11MYX1_30190 [soil metagenome]
MSRIGAPITIASLILARIAQADHTSVHVTASGNVAVSDNVFSAPSDANPVSDLYAQIRPGVLGAWETPRMVQTLAAEAEVLEYAEHDPGKPSLTLRGRWDALFLPGPRSELGLGAGASNGRVNALTARSSADQTTIAITPAGSQEIRQADAQQRLSWQSTKATRTSQQAFVRWAATNDNLAMPTTTDSVEVGAAVGFDRQFSHNGFGLEVGGSLLRLERISPAGSSSPSRLDRQLNPHASASWRHDYSKAWSSALSAGVIYVNPYGIDPHNPTAADRTAQPYPVFSATLGYTDVRGGATLTAGRAVSPNLFIAQNTVNEEVLARLALPLHAIDSSPRARDPQWTLLGSIGYDRSQLIDSTNAQVQGSFDIARADVALQWHPAPSQTYALRYEFVYQHGDTVGALVSPTFYRNTVLFEFAFRYPEMLAAQVPRRTGSVRADGGDLSPVGAEPVVPDAAEPAPSE